VIIVLDLTSGTIMVHQEGLEKAKEPVGKAGSVFLASSIGQT